MTISTLMVKYARILLSIILCTALVFSCDPDDDTNPLDELIGTWDVTSLSITDCNDPDDNSIDGQDIIGCVTEDGLEVCGAIALTFDENGNVTTSFTTTLTLVATGLTQTESDEEVSTFTVNGDEITICFDGDCDTFTYSVVGTTLTINGSDATDGCSTSFSGTKRP